MAASALLCTAATQATAVGLKCKPTVKVTNAKDATIRVINFKYKVGDNPEIFTEGLANKTLNKGETGEWPSQTLAHAALGIVISSTSVQYNDGFGSTQSSAWFDHKFECGNFHNYIQTVGP